jgi:hypothetical protein
MNKQMKYAILGTLLLVLFTSQGVASFATTGTVEKIVVTHNGVRVQGDKVAVCDTNSCTTPSQGVIRYTNAKGIAKFSVIPNTVAVFEVWNQQGKECSAGWFDTPPTGYSSFFVKC